MPAITAKISPNRTTNSRLLKTPGIWVQAKLISATGLTKINSSLLSLITRAVMSPVSPILLNKLKSLKTYLSKKDKMHLAYKSRRISRIPQQSAKTGSITMNIFLPTINGSIIYFNSLKTMAFTNTLSSWSGLTRVLVCHVQSTDSITSARLF